MGESVSHCRDAMFAPTSVSWQIVQATNGDHSHQHLHHHLIHHPTSASSLTSMTASIPASSLASSLASMTASVPASSLAPLAASVPASLPGPIPLDNQCSDIPVHDLPDSSENHHHLYSIPSVGCSSHRNRHVMMLTNNNSRI